MFYHIYQQHPEKLNDWNQAMLAPGQLQIYADTIQAKGAPLDSCFGFTDGTVRRIARPKSNQHQV